jgi:hypothetical protein
VVVVLVRKVALEQLELLTLVLEAAVLVQLTVALVAQEL